MNTLLKKIIIDSDAKNEIDDQYAITYAVLSGAFDIRGMTAAHFGKEGSMEKSYDEILHILKLLNKNGEYPVHKGAAHAMPDKKTPIDSDAVRFIIDEAKKCSKEHLYIISIGPLTNLASAYLMEPWIKDKVKVIWLAGKAWPKGGLFFNNRNDMNAAQVVFSSGMDLTLIPARGTADKLMLCFTDRKYVKSKGEIGSYLWKLFMRRFGIPKSIYDVVALAGLKSPDWCTWETCPRPRLLNSGTYDHETTTGMITVATGINAEMIKKDLFAVLKKAYLPR